MSDTDYATWLTKQQAADAIGVTTKTVEQLAKDRKLEQGFWRRPTGGPLLAVYNPDDVARIALERHPTPAPFVLPPGTAAAPPANGNGRQTADSSAGQALARPSSTTSADDLLQAFFERVARLAALAPASQSSQKSILTVEEAAAASGWSQTYLRRAIKDGRLKAEKDRGWKIRQRDLEAL